MNDAPTRATPQPAPRDPVAVIGMACRVPGGDGPEDLWRTLCAGDGMIGEVPADRLTGYDREVAGPAGLRAAVLEDVDAFDADFFGIGRRMAVWMDPQQRLLLETSWQALESAGIAPGSLRGQEVGVFVGCATSDFRDRMLITGTLDRYSAVGTIQSYLANRISHHYDLRGPSVTVDTACSSGLTAVAAAVSGLRAGDFDTALAGASNVCVAGWMPAAMAYMGALSPSGSCSPFSPGADGYVRGEGALCFVLRRLDDALRDGDPVMAVIVGSATNHDGRAGGLTRTDADSQTRLLRRTLSQAGLSPRTIGYLEAHAPGTSADGLEIDALRALLHPEADGRAGPLGGPDGRLWIGSVKAAVGHLEGAAGAVGLAEAVLVLVNGAIPGARGLLSLDPGLEAERLPPRPEPVPWPRDPARPRRAAVSSFGIGGSNAHLVLEEPPAAARESGGGRWTRGPLAVPLSAADEESLRRQAARLGEHLSTPAAGTELAPLAWTLQSGRDHLACRALLYARDLPGLRSALADLARGGPPRGPAGPAHPADAAEGTVQAGRAWLEGAPVAWADLWERPPSRRVRLPGYAFRRVPLGFAPVPRPLPAHRRTG
ncbi:polyketide synthase [Streptomyces longwoodensis]|uniref:polyketide synthase n=1 Tax=Streptomyces longwoodensis TaxID=68231 RepID=UPI000B140E7D|nr:polyketide synthase [Streptomyces longwoodensis]